MQLNISKAICYLEEERDSASSTFSRTEVILRILIGLDFKGLFTTRAAFLLPFSLWSKEKRHITLSPGIPAQSVLQILQQRPPPPFS